MRRQRQQRLELDTDRVTPARVLARNKFLQQGLVGSEVGEVARAAQLQRLLETGLQMAVRRFHRAVLVADAGIVAGRIHAVVAAELGIACRLVVLAGQVPVGRGKSIGTMRARHPTQLPQRLLQPLGERREALAAADRFDVLPATVGEPEMIKQMRERLAVQRHAEPAAVGEIRQRLKTRRMLLAKDQLALRPFGRPPVRHPALQRAQKLIGIAPRMVPLQLFQQRRRAQARHRLQQRHQLLAPDLGEGILARAVAPRPIPLAGQHRIHPEPASAALAKPGTSCRSRLAVALFA